MSFLDFARVEIAAMAPRAIESERERFLGRFTRIRPQGWSKKLARCVTGAADAQGKVLNGAIAGAMKCDHAHCHSRYGCSSRKLNVCSWPNGPSGSSFSQSETVTLAVAVFARKIVQW